MYESWSEDPSSVHASWAAYFETGGMASPDPTVSFTPVASSGGADHRLAALNQLVRSYEFAGHFVADLDPLGLGIGNRKGFHPTQIEPEYWGFSENDLDQKISLKGVLSTHFLLESMKDASGHVTLREVIDNCKKLFCGTIGWEYMHIADVNKCNWLRAELQQMRKTKLTANEKKSILKELAWAHNFESFLQTKYPAQKRFGLDGIESMIIALKSFVNQSSDLGVDDFVFGMPHRGRLNVLTNVIRKPLPQIFHEFSGQASPPDDVGGSGDVKYHLGASHDRLAGTKNDKLVHLSLVANPSHLETVGPVVLGKTRAKMHYKDDHEGKRTMAVLLHGDGSFAGQGVVYESLMFSDLPDYHTGGTLHLVVNNQVGFTTDPYFARSSPYCTSVSRAFTMPIMHVNADDPEAVFIVSNMAARYRQQWSSDVTIDLVGYRKYGHNEGDEPMFTQPLVYSRIAKMENAYKKYSDKLLAEGVIDQAFLDEVNGECEATLSAAHKAGQNWDLKVSDWLDSRWEGFKSAKDMCTVKTTGIEESEYEAIANNITNIPEGFTPHNKVKKVMIGRKTELDSGEGISWGTAEALAFGSLLREGCHIRLSGQDVERGTFSHRHAVLHEQKNISVNNRPQHRPLSVLDGSKATFTVCNSPLSEYGVLGFDLGYSLESPHALVLWEAQFGDFANGAQSIFDTYLSAGEQKWIRMSGLVCLLPHGFEGQGPEHSSCRIERFLQMVDDDPYSVPEINANTQVQVQATNWQVMNISTPSNYFHALRRQIHRNFRKPLIIASPKQYLRANISKKEEFVGDTKFERMIEDTCETLAAPEEVKRLLLCSGKVYWMLEKERARLGLNNVAISRIEQIAPFPFDRVIGECKRFPNAELYWVQEEPMNMGAWNYIEPRTRTCLQYLEDDRAAPGYVGRAAAAAPATGFPKLHKLQDAQILIDAFAGLNS